MRLHLINPSNPLVSILRLKESRWNRYRVWQHRAPLISLVGNLSYRRNSRLDCRAYTEFRSQRGGLVTA